MPALIDPQLHAFWTVARMGTVSGAAAQLGLSPDTLEAHLRSLELRLRVGLMTRDGDRAVVTRAGQDTLQACDEMIALGASLDDVLRGHREGVRVERLRVGVADVVPKVLAWRLLAPARALTGSRVRLSCVEGRQDRLMRQVERGELDMVLSDGPLSSERDLGAETLLLGECGVSLFASPSLARELERGGSDWLHRAPFLLPAPGTTLRADLDRWFSRHGLRPTIAGEFDDSALLKAFAAAGDGVFAMHDAAADELEGRLGFERVAGLSGLRQRIFAVVRRDQRERTSIRSVLAHAYEAFAHHERRATG